MRVSQTGYIELLVFVSIILMCSWTTYQRNFVWETDYTLWLDIVKKSPNKARPYNYLGLTYYKGGQLDNAITQYKKSLELKPYYASAHNNLGICYFDKGLVDKAINEFKHAIIINPSHIDAHYNLGVAYGSKELYDLAFEEIGKAKALSSEKTWKSIIKGIKGVKPSLPGHP